MPKRLTRYGNSLALVIDRPLLEALAIDAETELERSTDGDVLVVTPRTHPFVDGNRQALDSCDSRTASRL